MEIITDGFLSGDKILLEEITCRYCQEADCTEDQDGFQEIVISTRDGGRGKFINIKTESWSISDIEDINVLLDDFKKRIE